MKSSFLQEDELEAISICKKMDKPSFLLDNLKKLYRKSRALSENAGIDYFLMDWMSEICKNTKPIELVKVIESLDERHSWKYIEKGFEYNLREKVILRLASHLMLMERKYYE